MNISTADDHFAFSLGELTYIDSTYDGESTDSIAKAEPDGYSLLYHSTTGIVHAAVTERLPYDWLHDLAPVAIITRFAPVMIIPPTVPANDLKEFIALLKANPGKYSFASSGTGTAVHLAEELFKQKAGVDMVHVPYRGTAAAMADAISESRSMVPLISLIAPTDSCVAAWMPDTCCPISPVAFAVCSASAFTSLATTAKPRPASPARAASIVAFSAIKLVCPAMVLISSTTSPIRLAAFDNSLTRSVVLRA